MPSRKQRERDVARRRYERRQARLAKASAKRRRRTKIAAVVMVVVALMVLSSYGIYHLVASGGNDSKTLTTQPTTQPSASPSTTPVACGASKPPAPKHETWPHAPAMSIDKQASYTMTLATSCGPIAVALDAAKAPITTNTLKFLADKKFYDGTFCHRLVVSAGLTVLQCGDPTGTGSGGPGFTIPEENLKGAKYTRGIVAMAKTSAPHSTSSQFFLIDKDSQLPPQYTVVGHIALGLGVLDRITALGEDDSNGPGDGHPNQTVYLDHVTVVKTG